jgi:N-acetylmuramic acid 6-phosphate etherase
LNKFNQNTDLLRLVTEASNTVLTDLDTVDTLERLRLMNAEDSLVATAVREELPQIAQAVKSIVRSFKAGGRLVYVGAGTSGRLGVLDAAECPPTFGTNPSQVIAIIAGGRDAIFEAIEGAEDDYGQGMAEMDLANVGTEDTVVGISASGQAPFVLGALERASVLGATTVAVANNRPNKLQQFATITIAPIVGPEVIAGSTRMKAGTAQKMVLNLLSTAAMIELGKTFGNRMVDVRATNSKLKRRAIRIVTEMTGATEEQALRAISESEGSAKLAILLLKTGLTVASTRDLMERNNGFLRRAIEEFSGSTT